ncbi:uncharacterized protein BDR25DRAFT_323927 [Lindgomyces ingoldianus]|uniref:Uncharacterized protein n=1 Tax=Lindgomyces ingoldianus TaxID=673940 RepID=A0ACB6R2A4_9PLEO|nr:uncharacterized protein BDR25DRAFT_323927 [Lindgomyces ingoldianus]KAF2473379.1 hypothetical protein BDR25DRAFT_323927 [Lindgomyces ingoldianus]
MAYLGFLGPRAAVYWPSRPVCPTASLLRIPTAHPFCETDQYVPRSCEAPALSPLLRHKEILSKSWRYSAMQYSNCIRAILTLKPSLCDHGADSELRRLLGTRHVTMIALGSSIGMGLWLGSGKSLASGGPAGIFLGYLLAGSMIWSVSHSIGEMAVMYPLPSAFVQWSGKFVCPSAAFALGWAYWVSYVITIANELQAVCTVLGFWTDKVPVAAWITIFWFVIIAVNIGAVTVFGEVEVVCSTIKFGWIFVVIFSLIIVSAGGAPNHDAVGFRYWNAEPFTHGFKWFLSVMPTCIFAMAGSENSGLVAAETTNPRKAVPRAVGSIWLRLSLFYLLGALMVTITVSPDNPDIFGGNGTNASPFVIAYRNASIPALAHIMNAVIFISVLSTGSISGYGGSRTTMGLAHLGMAPAAFKKADKTGRPWWGLALTLTLGGALAYLNVGNKAADVFTWLSNLTSLFTLFGWGMICLSHIRMRYSWKLQGRDLTDLPWKSWTYPYAAWLYYRGPWWVDASMIDLDASRRFYVDGDVEKTEKKGGVGGFLRKTAGFVFN